MPTRLPTIASLQTFETVARHGSFASASKERCVSASAISHQISDLETLLDIELFHREPNGIKLTRAGKFYLRYVQDLLSKLSIATSTVRGYDDAVVSIQTYASVSRRMLIPDLSNFRTAYPKLSIQFQSIDSHLYCPVNDAVLENHNIYILCGQPEIGDYESYRLAGSSLVLICSRAYAKKAPPLKAPRDIAEHELTRYVGSEDDWESWVAMSGETPALLPSNQTFANRDMAVLAAENNLGLALAPEFVARRLEAGGDMMIPFDLRLPYPDLYLILPKVLKDIPYVRTFCDWLLTESVFAN